MNRSFKHNSTRDSFEKDGYVVLPLLNDSEVQQLLDYHQSLEHDYHTPYGFSVSIDAEHPDFIRNIHEKIIRISQRGLDEHFQNYQTFSGRFLTKSPNRHSVVSPHQDWSFVEEENHCSSIIWIALVDVDIHNGALAVLKGSHTLPTGFRATPLPTFKAPYEHFSDELFSHMDLVPMKAGEAMVMDNRLIHGSPPNLSESERVVAGFEMAHEDAQLVHYNLVQKEGQSFIRKYEIDDSFFFRYSNAKLKAIFEEHKEIDTFRHVTETPLNQQEWSRDEFWEYLGGQDNYPNDEILQGLFDYSFGHVDHPPTLNQPKKEKSLFKKWVSWVNK